MWCVSAEGKCEAEYKKKKKKLRKKDMFQILHGHKMAEFVN